MLRSTTISIRSVILSPAKSTNRDARLRWPNGAQSWPDPHLEFRLSHQTHTVMHRSRFCLTRPSWLLVGILHRRSDWHRGAEPAAQAVGEIGLGADKKINSMSPSAKVRRAG